jgi:hypothetical protein
MPGFAQTSNVTLGSVNNFLGGLFQSLGNFVDSINDFNAQWWAPLGTAGLQALGMAESVTSLSVTAAGSGYTSPPTVSIGPPDVPGGVPAYATAKISSGAITGFVITQAGSGYVNVPAVTISGGGGSGGAAGAALTANVITLASAIGDAIALAKVIQGTETVSSGAYAPGTGYNFLQFIGRGAGLTPRN